MTNNKTNGKRTTRNIQTNHDKQARSTTRGQQETKKLIKTNKQDQRQKDSKKHTN